MSGRPPSGFALRETRESDVRVLEVAGELVVETVPELEERLAELRHDEDVVLDLAEASFIDSTGLRLLLLNRDRINASGHRCVLVAVPDSQVEGLLEFVEVKQALEVEPTREQAIGRIRGR